MRRLLAGVVVIVAIAGACGADGGEQRVVVAAGTTLVDSGLIDALAERYEQAHPGVEISVVGEASAQVLELGRRGAADVLITHAPALEAQFLADGLAASSEIVFSSRFVLLAPPEVASRLSAAIDDALAEVGAAGMDFVSRGDGSGTHERELELWASAGVDPAGAPWYRETGQGMGLTLIVADQTAAVTFAEEGVYLAAADQFTLTPVQLDPDERLVNLYRLILVADAQPGAGEFARWLTTEGADLLEAINEELFGSAVYQPAS